MLPVPMRGASNIILIGPMGSGKTAVGRSLARHLGKAFHDSDTEIVRRTGVDIPYIFEKEGEPGFREREQEAIEALVALREIVLATG
ncbi:MAG: shikimate kinase, partial [Acetobacteraceae bacterium]